MNITQSISGFLTPYAHEKITVSTAVKQFTAAKIEPTSSVAERELGHARLILVTVEAQTIRYTFDGTTPTVGDIGHLAEDKVPLSFANLQAMRNFKAVRENGADATLQVTYLR